VSAPAPAAGGAAQAATPIRVLLADDQPLIRLGFRMVLSSAPDIELVGDAETGAAAVDLTTSLRPDVVLMDVRMPGMDGIEPVLRTGAGPGYPAGQIRTSRSTTSRTGCTHSASQVVTPARRTACCAFSHSESTDTTIAGSSASSAVDQSRPCPLRSARVALACSVPVAIAVSRPHRPGGKCIDDPSLKWCSDRAARQSHHRLSRGCATPEARRGERSERGCGPR